MSASPDTMTPTPAGAAALTTHDDLAEISPLAALLARELASLGHPPPPPDGESAERLLRDTLGAEALMALSLSRMSIERVAPHVAAVRGLGWRIDLIESPSGGPTAARVVLRKDGIPQASGRTFNVPRLGLRAALIMAIAEAVALGSELITDSR